MRRVHVVCTGDNKNLAMLGFSGLLLLMDVFQVVQINFLILGHTHAVRNPRARATTRTHMF